jgi:hypothetical protein
MTAPRVIADVHRYDDLYFALRARVRELQLPLESLDALTGLQSGYSAKVLSPNLGRPNGRVHVNQRIRCGHQSTLEGAQLAVVS